MPVAAVRAVAVARRRRPRGHRNAQPTAAVRVSRGYSRSNRPQAYVRTLGDLTDPRSHVPHPSMRRIKAVQRRDSSSSSSSSSSNIFDFKTVVLMSTVNRSPKPRLRDHSSEAHAPAVREPSFPACGSYQPFQARYISCAPPLDTRGLARSNVVHGRRKALGTAHPRL